MNGCNKNILFICAFLCVLSHALRAQDPQKQSKKNEHLGIDAIMPVPQCPVPSGTGLPAWTLDVTVHQDHQRVDFRTLPPTVTSLTPSFTGVPLWGGTAVDNCGRVVFYVNRTSGAPAHQLHFYTAGGTQITNTTAGSAMRGLTSSPDEINPEIQIVQVPGFTDEWFVIYSLYEASPSFTASNGYYPARVVYARVRFTGTNTLTFISRDVDVNPSVRFLQGKAVSSFVNGDTTKHYLYLAERRTSTPGGAYMNFIRFYRYTISSSGIGFQTISPNWIGATFWAGANLDQSLELSPDGNFLALANPNIQPSANLSEDIILFDTRQFTNAAYTARKLMIMNFNVTFDWSGQTITRDLYQISNQSPYNATYACLDNIKNNVNSIEFSPNGRYLYAIGGRHSNTTASYNTYLMQIDLATGGTSNEADVSIQVQNGWGSYTNCYGGSASSNSWHKLREIQSAYNGRLYFTKDHETKLFVIPEPNCKMPQNLVKSEIDLSLGASAPNISLSTNAEPVYFPEQIDGHSYVQDNTSENFHIDTQSILQYGSVSVWLDAYLPSNQYWISWGDGSPTQTVTSVTPITHMYDFPGRYRVVATILDNTGCAKSSTWYVGVTDCPFLLNLAITGESYACASKFSTPSIATCPVTYLWNFGDGNTSQAQNPIHKYAAAGWYPVSLTVTYDCAPCVGDTTLTMNYQFNPNNVSFQNTIVQVNSETKTRVLSSTVSTFADNWGLQHEASSLVNKSGYVNGTDGVWRNNASYVYETPRTQSDPVSLKNDGTYSLNHFNWRYADLDAVPNWIKATTMTEYSPYSYELENRDVLGVYTSALYDYGGHLPTANGVNMRNKEMAFTSFENIKTSTGNFIFGNAAVQQFTPYAVASAENNIAEVIATPGQLQGVPKVNINAYVYSEHASKTYNGSDVVCVQPHPNTTTRSIVVFRDAPQEKWYGNILVPNTASPAVVPQLDSTFAHTGKTSLKITAAQTFRQSILKLDSGKIYVISCWVSVKNFQATTSDPLPGTSVTVYVKRKNETTYSTYGFTPSGPIIEGWQLLRSTFYCGINNAVIDLRFAQGTSGAWYDDLRLHPEKGNMKTYVYDLKDYRLRAILDEENFASLFYYDAEGNLYLTKKETVRGIKTLTENISYQYER